LSASGKLPASLGNLVHLQSLDLEGNSISGPLPGTLGKLAQLQVLHLGLNQISGPLPRELGALSKLQILDAPFNRISGALPAELGKLASLQILDLGGNQISGALPPQLGTLRLLSYLDLSENRLTGAIPAARIRSTAPSARPIRIMTPPRQMFWLPSRRLRAAVYRPSSATTPPLAPGVARIPIIRPPTRLSRRSGSFSTSKQVCGSRKCEGAS